MTQLSPSAFKRGLIISGGAGILIGLAMCVAFGVLDIQCERSPNGQYWNAERQQCQATEVQA